MGDELIRHKFLYSIEVCYEILRCFIYLYFRFLYIFKGFKNLLIGLSTTKMQAVMNARILIWILRALPAQGLLGLVHSVAKAVLVS